MTVPTKYRDHFVATKYFLSSYRALSDGKSGIRKLSEDIKKSDSLLFNWKVSWIGTCTILRTAIDLFQVDAKSCISVDIRREISKEWEAIRKYKDEHAIFWKFLREERNNIIHEYKWSAYEAWIKPDGTFSQKRLSLLEMAGGRNDGSKPSILMKSGHYEGRNTIELLEESAAWVERRIFDAIIRAGFQPDEIRNLVNFKTRSDIMAAGKRSLLGND